MADVLYDCPTVLVVDDYPDSRIMLRAALESKGMRVIEAADGEEAVREARGRCPDLILMDLNMPTMDGLEASRRIRECRDLCRGIPIVAVTAHDVYGIEEAAREAGCDAYLRKPLDFAELDRMLRRLVPGYCPTSGLTPPRNAPRSN